MLQNDYIMRLILQLIAAIRRSLLETDAEPRERADAIEEAIGQTVNMDPELLFSLEPESMVTMLSIGGTVDVELCGYIVESMLYESKLLDGSDAPRATLRSAQARALASSFGYTIGDCDLIHAAEQA
jgi:hypothetical protein